MKSLIPRWEDDLNLNHSEWHRTLYMHALYSLSSISKKLKAKRNSLASLLSLFVVKLLRLSASAILTFSNTRKQIMTMKVFNKIVDLQNELFMCRKEGKETALSKIEAGSMDADTFRKGIEVYATQITTELLSVQLSVAGGETCPQDSLPDTRLQ